MRDPEDAKALQEAMLAMDGAIQTMVMARIMLGDRYAAAAAPETEQNDAGDGKCQHNSTVDVSTQGARAEMCVECGEFLGVDSE